MLIKMAEDPDTKRNAQAGIDKIALSMGLEAENRAEVLERIEHLIDELSYIEALKDRFRGIKNIGLCLNQVQKDMKDDKTLKEEISRIKALMAEPMKRYAKIFRALDQQTKDVHTLIEHYTTKLDLIRRARDDLRSALLDWEEMIDLWADQTIETDSGVENLVRKTYRFVATNFPLSQSW